jgi:hypothetical protein
LPSCAVTINADAPMASIASAALDVVLMLFFLSFLFVDESRCKGPRHPARKFQPLQSG